MSGGELADVCHLVVAAVADVAVVSADVDDFVTSKVDVTFWCIVELVPVLATDDIR